MSVPSVEPAPRPRDRSKAPPAVRPDRIAPAPDLAQRVALLAAATWAFLAANPAWVLSVALHLGLLTGCSLVVWNAQRERAGAGIEGSLLAGGDGGAVGGGGHDFESLIGSAEIEITAPPAPAASAFDALASFEQTGEADAAEALRAIERSGLAGAGGGSGSGSGSGSGDGIGDDSGSGTGPGLGAGFFGTQGDGRTFVYVVDMSGSMEGQRFRRAIVELVRSINRLNPPQKFFVYFFNDRTFPLYDPRPAKGLQLASTGNKDRATRWIRSRKPSSTTNPLLALQLALEMKPDVIFLLTDGELDDPTEVRHMIRKHNTAGTTIHTIAYENEDGAVTLETIATENKGTFRFVK